MTVPVRTFQSEDAALRAVRWLQRSRIPAGVSTEAARFAVLVPTERRAEAEEVLDRRAGGPPPLPTSTVGLGERIFNVENALAVIFGAAIVALAAFAIVTATIVAVSLGAVLSVALVIAGLAYFHFSGSHGAVRSPRRLSRRAGPVTQGHELNYNYRMAWLKEQYRRGRRSGNPDDDTQA